MLLSFGARDNYFCRCSLCHLAHWVGDNLELESLLFRLLSFSLVACHILRPGQPANLSVCPVVTGMGGLNGLLMWHTFILCFCQ